MSRTNHIKLSAINYAGTKNEAYIGFIRGAEWADANPKNPWIRREEREPDEKDGVEIVISYVYCGIRIHGVMFRDAGKWTMHPYKQLPDYDFWMPLMPTPMYRE